MLAAKDPETGLPMTEAEVKDNVMTFIFGGRETTSSHCHHPRNNTTDRSLSDTR